MGNTFASFYSMGYATEYNDNMTNMFAVINCCWLMLLDIELAESAAEVV